MAGSDAGSDQEELIPAAPEHDLQSLDLDRGAVKCRPCFAGTVAIVTGGNRGILAGDGASYISATTIVVDGGIMQSSPGL